MIQVWQVLKDRIQGKAPKGAKRSKEWRRVRKEHIRRNPTCAVCGTNKKLEVHHKYPYHLFPDLELEPSNLVTLCDGGGRSGMKSCHFFFGHLGNWKKFNSNIDEDGTIWRRRLNGK